MQKSACDLGFQYIHAPLVKRVYAECSPLFQLIKLINSLRNDPNDTSFLKTNDEKNHSYNSFAFNVTRIFLDTYFMIPSAEQKSAMFADFNKTIMTNQYLVIIIIIGNICV